MTKIEIDDKVIDKLVGKRVVQFNKIERDLEAKLTHRDNKIKKLQKEIESMKGQLMATKGEVVVRIAKVAEALVAEMEYANWVTRVHEGEDCEDCTCHEFY